MPDIELCSLCAELPCKGSRGVRPLIRRVKMYRMYELILMRFWDLAGIPIVCRYVLSVLGIWLGTSALLFLARCIRLPVTPANV